MNELITIYTATYNRVNLLPRVYESLNKQTKKNFVWMVVDDGSTDNTRELITRWMSETTSYKILYYYKENGGIHTARDFAYAKCYTELIVSLDSDDWMVPEAVEMIVCEWDKIEDKNQFAGLIGVMQSSRGNIVTNNFPSTSSMSYQFFKYCSGASGDFVDVFRSDVMKAIPNAPTFAGEKLVGERYKTVQIPNHYMFKLVDEPLEVIEYQECGYSYNAYNNLFNNINGFREDYKQHIISGAYSKVRLKGQLGYIACCIEGHYKNAIKDSPQPIATMLLWPLGFCSLVLLRKRRTEKRFSDSKRKENTQLS